MKLCINKRSIPIKGRQNSLNIKESEILKCVRIYEQPDDEENCSIAALKIVFVAIAWQIAVSFASEITTRNNEKLLSENKSKQDLQQPLRQSTYLLLRILKKADFLLTIFKQSLEINRLMSVFVIM